ncbi:MAG TPA: addiction module protein [Thauera sp.]|nr:addiction module protein [Thauera sp.]HHW64913.1 addiction module protein [Rhodocyclaceae bacterium]
MHRSIKELGIDRLSVADRIALAQEIWDSVAESLEQTPPGDAAVAELECRRAEDDLEPETAIDWQEIRSAARGR